MRYILIFVLIIIFIIFLFTIGIFNNLNFKKINFFSNNFSTSSLYSYLPYNNFYLSSPKSNNNLKDVPKEKISPYAGKIKIENIKNYKNNLNYEEIVLAANNLKNNEKIDITGWSLVSNKSNFVITFGLKNLDFSQVFKESNIVLGNRYKVKIYSTYSPVGVNFELNKCAGYLNESYNFIPKLPQNCPKIEKRDIAHLSGICQEYILNLKACELPKQFEISDPACLNYLKNINYQGCFQKNKNNLDFYSKEWFIFMGREILDDLHDKVILYDRKGLIVDEYFY